MTHRPVDVEPGSTLLWRVAGCPETPEIIDCSEPSALCWWCARACGPRAAPSSGVPDTFPDAPLAGCRRSPWLCPACAWSISGDAILPPGTTAGTLTRRLADGGRVVAKIAGSDPVRRLVLTLDTGSVGVWQAGENAAAEEPWKAEIATLRTNPRDIGPCAYLGSVAPSDVVVEDRGAMRLYHHVGSESRGWKALTSDASGRAQLRAWLTEPPPERWVGCIGDGQKHGLPRAEVSDGRQPFQIVSLVGQTARYLPADLLAWIFAWESMLVAGAGDAEIIAGTYHRGSLATVAAARKHEPALMRLRARPVLLDLVNLLRRSRTDLGLS